jgi:putative hydrolase of the HAD superfamily
LITAVISDFGGVLTSPLLDSFTAFGEQSGIPPEQLGAALGVLWSRGGANPLFELETGRMTEAAFLRELGAEVARSMGRPVEMAGFGEHFFEHLRPNERMIDFMRDLKARDYKLAICTNNVREWEARWRAMLPVDELFDAVVDSAFVGARKPEPEIYRVTLERLDVPANQALFIDDVELNCQGARDVGIAAVWFRSDEQAIADVEVALNGGAAAG